MSNQNKEKKQEKKCFIITPIGNETDPIRRHINGVLDEAIIPVLEDEYDYKIEVSHRMSNIGSINKQILESIYFSELVIANLTNLNPNVMYELAFRHSTGKPVITIAEQGTNIPFDVIDSRTIFYINDPTGMSKLRDDLRGFMKNNDFSTNDFGPIIDTFKGIGYEQQLNKAIDQAGLDGDISKLLNLKLNEILDKIDRLNITTNSIQNNKINSLDINEKHLIILDKEIEELYSKVHSFIENYDIEYLLEEIKKYKTFVNEVNLGERNAKYNQMLSNMESYIDYYLHTKKSKLSTH